MYHGTTTATDGSGGVVMTVQPHQLSRFPFTAQLTTETRSATGRPREVDLDAVERFFITEDRNAVRAFLTQRPFLVPLLFEARQEIVLSFGNSPLHLAVTTDSEDGIRHLTLSICTSLPPQAAVAQLQQFDARWWLDALDRARGALLISITSDEL